MEKISIMWSRQTKSTRYSPDIKLCSNIHCFSFDFTDWACSQSSWIQLPALSTLLSTISTKLCCQLVSWLSTFYNWWNIFIYRVTIHIWSKKDGISASSWFILTNYVHLNRGSVNLVDMCATYRPRIVSSQPSAILPLVVDGSNSHCPWPRVSPSIVQYSLNDLGRMEDWVGLAARGGREIWWYNLYGESNPGHSDGSTMLYPSWFSHLYN